MTDPQPTVETVTKTPKLIIRFSKRDVKRIHRLLSHPQMREYRTWTSLVRHLLMRGSTLDENLKPSTPPVVP